MPILKNTGHIRNNFSGVRAPRRHGGQEPRHGSRRRGERRDSGGTNGANGGTNGGTNDGANDGAGGCGAPTTTPRAMEGPGRSDGGVVGGPARQKRQASGAAPPVSKGSGDRHDEGPVPRNNCRKRAATLVAAVPEWPRRPALPGGRTEGEPGTGRSEGKPGTGRSEGKPGTGRVRGRTWRRRTRCGAARVRRCRRHPSRRRGPGRAGSCRTCSSRRRSAPAATAA